MTKKNVKAAAAKVRVQAKESVNSEVMVQVAEAFGAMTQAECKKAAKLVLDETLSLNQAIKVFGGLWDKRFKTDKRTYTLKELCAQIGMQKMSVSELRRVWALKDAQGCLAVWANVTATLIQEEGAKGTKVLYQDVTKGEDGTETLEWKTVRRYQAVTVQKWTARTILNGILQSIFADKESEKAAKSAADVENIMKGDLYIFRSQIGKGGVNNKAHKLSDSAKSQIMF